MKLPMEVVSARRHESHEGPVTKRESATERYATVGSRRVPLRWLLAIFCFGFGFGCESPVPDDASYYDREIEPPLVSGCQMTTSGCHLANERGSAPGNLDLSSYDSLRRRYDLLVPYGPYALPLFLLKTGEPDVIAVDVHDPPDPSQPDVRTVLVETDIRHAGGRGLPQGSLGRSRIQRWLAEGFDRHGAIRESPAQTSSGPCAEGAGHAPGFSALDVPDAALFDAFLEHVQPVLAERCAGGACHGAPLADFHLSCGETDDERRWNFWISSRFLGDPVERSELLRKPLAVADGGGFHGGGDTFATRDDPEYRALQAWAERVANEAPELVRDGDVSDGYRYFVNRVQPTLVRKGCMALACHSPLSVAFHLRGGSSGAFSRLSRHINYDESRAFLALESDDPNQSRIVAKNLHPAHLVPEAHGMLHRGGALFEDFDAPASEAACESYDAESDPLSEVPAYCILRRWHAIERAERIGTGELSPDVRGVVFVRRPPGVGSFTDFDTYRPGADLRFAHATTVDGELRVEESRSLLDACGLTVASADVRRPRASWDGTRVLFAARSAATEPLRLFELDPLAETCLPIDAHAGRERDGDVLVHDFDPAVAPDGSIVFASTRGSSHGRATRTAARLEPNADLYVLSPDRTQVRQLTFLLNQELAPGFLANGQVIYTVEKRELEFHALALRRQNLDGGDYHPLYASRTSIGFDAAFDVGVLPNGNGLFLGSTLDAVDGAGSIYSFNRSLGPDQSDRGLTERGYFPSLHEHLRSAIHGGRGLYRSPSPLPSGRVLVSCADDGDPDDFDVCELEPRSGTTRRLFGEVGSAEVDAIALYARPRRGVLASDGGGVERPVVVPGERDARIQFNDFPMIQSLMFANTREGRPIDDRIGGFEVLVHRPPPADLRELVGPNVVTDSRGAFYSDPATLGWVPLYGDGSTSLRMVGGLAISFAMTDAGGDRLPMRADAPFEGMATQREHEQYYPGERIKRSIPRRFFNTACGGCHGSITGRELDVAIDVDIVTGASQTQARGAEPHDLVP